MTSWGRDIAGVEVRRRLDQGVVIKGGARRSVGDHHGGKVADGRGAEKKTQLMRSKKQHRREKKTGKTWSQAAERKEKEGDEDPPPPREKGSSLQQDGTESHHTA